MEPSDIVRKDLDREEFLKLRRAAERICDALTKRLQSHLEVLKALFLPRKLLGTYVKSAFSEEVAGSERVFAMLRERYAAIAEDPFGLPRKLQPPLPPMSNQLDVIPFQYPLYCKGSEDKAVTVTSPTSWILFYRSDCPISRLKAMLAGAESPQPEDMRRSLLDHMIPVIFLERFPALKNLLEDLRYQVETRELSDLGKLPVVIIKAPLKTFLPADDFILQVTQLSGVPAFQEIIDLESLEKLPDPLKESLIALVE
jgi:hypothetical protein